MSAQTQTPSPNDEGEDWLYWESPMRKWRRVELLAVPEGAKRVRVQHLDADMKGKAEWVPVGRLRVPWRLREDYLSGVDRWDRISEGAPSTQVTDVALMVLPLYVPEDVAEIEGNGAEGALRVRDVAKLSAASGIPAELLTGSPVAFREGDEWLAPWSTAEAVLRAVCRADPSPALSLLEEWTRRRSNQDRRSADDGDPWWLNLGPDADERDVKTARLIRRWDERALEDVRTLRSWIDGDAEGLAESYLALQQMYTEIVRAVRDALPRIRTARSQVAERIADDLDALISRPTPVPGVRSGEQHHTQ